MTAKKYIKTIKAVAPALPAADLLSLVAYQHNGKTGWESSDDKNAYFREDAVDLLFENYSDSDRLFIRFLLEEELKYAGSETLMRETLRQLTFMIFVLGYPEDLPLLIEAKLDCCFDASCALDQELLLGRDKAAAIAYFSKYPHEDYDVLAIIEKYEQHGLRSAEEFITGMNEYYNK